LLAASALVFCVALRAQDTATIVGTVRDSSGGVIPGAKVVVSNSEKGFTREFTTNTAGEYTAAKVPLGDYVITAENEGFQKLVRSGITLAVGQTLRVDLQLQVGQRTQEITVAANAPRVETETAAVSDVVGGTQISNLELNGRNFVQLALLVPGAAPSNFLNTTTVGVFSNTTISFNGGRYEYNNWEVDGGNNTDEGSNATLNTYPSLDTIAEFRISTSNYGAEMGKHAGHHRGGDEVGHQGFSRRGFRLPPQRPPGCQRLVCEPAAMERSERAAGLQRQPLRPLQRSQDAAQVERVRLQPRRTVLYSRPL